MENYAKILQTLENNVRLLQQEKENAIFDKNKAQEDSKTIRQRYMNIVGIEQF